MEETRNAVGTATMNTGDPGPARPRPFRRGRLRWLGLALLGQLLCLSQAGQALAADAGAAQGRGADVKAALASPATALLSPSGGRLEVEERLAPVAGGPDAGRTLRFAIPADAANLQLSVPGQTVVRWSSSPVALAESGALARAREALLAERGQLAARLVTVKAAIALWQAQPENAGPQDLAQRTKLLEEAMPDLVLRQEALEKRINLLQQRIERLPAGAELGQLVSVTLQKPVPGGEKVAVRYSYTWPHCGWEAVYDFNARPEEGSGGSIDVRLMADVWQYSGIDWRGTRVTLATRGGGPREPAPLPEWVVDSQPRPQPRAVPMMLNARGAKLSAEGAADAVPAAAGVTADTASVYASWTLAEAGLPEGRSRLQIAADAWKAPLQWLARPSRGDSRVWLLAKYTLPGTSAWPEGAAEYSVDGQSVGSGVFRPRGGEATLYFGADPRVSVRTFDDARKKGESGIIKTSKTWTWAWTYTVSNGHARPVTVRLERPAPVIVDEGVTVTYKDEPPAQKNEQEHMLFWNVEVPGNGKASVKHSVTISSPEKLPLFPDVP